MTKGSSLNTDGSGYKQGLNLGDPESDPISKAYVDRQANRRVSPANDALTYCRLALVALDFGDNSEANNIISSLIERLIDAGARDFMEDDSDSSDAGLGQSPPTAAGGRK